MIVVEAHGDLSFFFLYSFIFVVVSTTLSVVSIPKNMSRVRACGQQGYPIFVATDVAVKKQKREQLHIPKSQ